VKTIKQEHDEEQFEAWRASQGDLGELYRQKRHREFDVLIKALLTISVTAFFIGWIIGGLLKLINLSPK
jgi:hypothetical protein